MVKRLVLLSLLGLVLVACSSTQTPTPTPAPTSPPMPTNTPTSLPTPTSAPTSTPLTETNYVESVRKMIFRDWMDAQNSKVGDEDVRQEIARRWGIGVDAVEHIVAEGLNKKWLQSAATATPVSPTAMPVSPTATPVPTLSPEEQLAQSLHEPWAAEEWETVIGLINQILAINPGYDDMTEKLYAAHVNYGRQLVSEGKLGEAKWEFTRALYVKPNGAEAMLELAALAGETPRPVTVVLPGEVTPTPRPVKTTPNPVPLTPVPVQPTATPIPRTVIPTATPIPQVSVRAWPAAPLSYHSQYQSLAIQGQIVVNGQIVSDVPVEGRFVDISNYQCYESWPEYKKGVVTVNCHNWIETGTRMSFELIFTYGESKYKATTTFLTMSGALDWSTEPSNKTGDVVQAFELLNNAREENDTPPLTLHPALSRLADLRAKDLVGQEHISHETPTYGYIEDMLEGTRIQCCLIAENVRRSKTVYECHDGLMLSDYAGPAMLWTGFTDVGIGVADCQVEGETGKILVQLLCQDPNDMKGGEGFREVCRW